MHLLSGFLTQLVTSSGAGSILLLKARSLLAMHHWIREVCVTASHSFLCVIKTWLREIIADPTLMIPGYILHRTVRCGTLGGGCAIYAKAELRAALVDEPSLCRPHESMWIITTTIPPPFYWGACTPPY